MPSQSEPDSPTPHEAAELRRLFEFTIERAADAVFWIAPDGHFAHVNQAACSSLGYSREELLRMSVHDIDPDFPAQRWPGTWKEVQEKRAFSFETTHRAKDGRIIPVEIRVNYLEFDGRQYNIAFARDISERRKAAEALEESRRFLLEVLDATPDATIVIDCDHRVVLANRAARELAGSVDPVQAGIKCHQLSHHRETPCEGPNDLCPLTQVVQSKTPTTVRHTHWDAAGQEYIVEITAAPILDREGQVVQMVEACRDITDRVRAQQAVERERAFLRTVIDAVPSFIFAKDINGRFVLANRSVAQAYGTTVENLEGRTDADFNPNVEEVAHFRQDDAEVILNVRGKCIPEEQVTDAQGHVRFLKTYKIPLQDKTGACHQVLGVATDITDLKLAEQALRTATEELQRSNKDLEQFAYVASHDLQEPLRMVTSFLGLVCKRSQGQLDDKSQRFIDYAVDGANRMSIMIKDLLEYSRVSARSKQPAPVDMPAVVDEVKANLHASIEESDAMLIVEPLPTVMADAAQMRQLFQNLIGNALKFRVEGRRPEVRIGARREAGMWVFHVKDNGIGIDPKQIDRLFQLFQRLHDREKYPGTGIGLAICKKIVERHGGTIWIESKEGEGSTFCFTLPAQAG